MRSKSLPFKLKTEPLFFAVPTLLLALKTDPVVLIALFSSILHECGHLVVCLILGIEIKSVTLSFYGMKLIRKDELKTSFKQEIAVCSAGVVVNALAFLVFLLLYAFSPKLNFLRISAVNLILGLFNILPVYSLDGGRIIEYILKQRLSLLKAEKILKIISVSVIIPIFFVGIYYLFEKNNFTLIVCAVYLLLSSVGNSDIFLK